MSGAYFPAATSDLQQAVWDRQDDLMPGADVALRGRSATAQDSEVAQRQSARPAFRQGREVSGSNPGLGVKWAASEPGDSSGGWPRAYGVKGEVLIPALASGWVRTSTGWVAA